MNGSEQNNQYCSALVADMTEDGALRSNYRTAVTVDLTLEVIYIGLLFWFVKRK